MRLPSSKRFYYKLFSVFFLFVSVCLSASHVFPVGKWERKVFYDMGPDDYYIEVIEFTSNQIRLYKRVTSGDSLTLEMNYERVNQFFHYVHEHDSVSDTIEIEEAFGYCEQSPGTLFVAMARVFSGTSLNLPGTWNYKWEKGRVGSVFLYDSMQLSFGDNDTMEFKGYEPMFNMYTTYKKRYADSSYFWVQEQPLYGDGKHYYDISNGKMYEYYWDNPKLFYVNYGTIGIKDDFMSYPETKLMLAGNNFNAVNVYDIHGRKVRTNKNVPFIETYSEILKFHGAGIYIITGRHGRTARKVSLVK